MTVQLSNTGLAANDLVAISRHDAALALDDAALAAIASSAAIIDRILDQGESVYGVTTGFGALADTPIPPERSAELQVALVRSHAAGMGPLVEREVVRATMALRARSLARGYSGVRPIVVETIIAMLNAGITPAMHEHGSLGASGDLAPLAHCAMGIIGEGDIVDDLGQRRAAAEALKEAGITPVKLRAKEGLALINGTDGMLGMLLLALADLEHLLKVADIAAALTVEGLMGTDRVFAADLQELRPQLGQAESATNLRILLADSEIMASHRENDTRVQDAYSLRCTPAVHGAVRDTIAHAKLIAKRELASAIDNPMILPDGRVESCGNFHGAPVAQVADFLAMPGPAGLRSQARRWLGTCRLRNGLLVTNQPEQGEGPLGLIRNVSVVIADGEVVSIGVVGQIADKRIDAEGRCVLPGFVDSHTHLVFAGDRSEEFTKRMAGQPYDGGGIQVTTNATRAASDDELRALTLTRLAEARRAGTTTIEIKSGYGLNVEDEARSLRLAQEVTPETTFLGAHLLPSEYADRADDYIDLVCGDMLDAAKPHARWIDAFCEVGAFDEEQCRKVLTVGKEAGLGLRLHGNQLGHGPGVQLGVEMGCASVDHCTYLSNEDVDALANSDTVATFLPATDFSTRQPYANARRVTDAGVTVAIASNCNPGSSYTTSLSFCIALAVRDMGMTIEEAIQAVTVGGAAALQREDVGYLAPGAKGHLIILDTVTYHDLAYRPGVPLIAQTIC